MFYEPRKGNHGLPRDPFKSLVAPRPIGWIGSFAGDRTPNLAPYSFFNMVSGNPPIVYFSSEGRKDSINNVDETRAFSCNMVGEALTHQMNQSSAGVSSDINEFDLASLTQKTCSMVDAPYVAEAYAVLECVHLETKPMIDQFGEPTGAIMVLGEVVGVHISDDALTDGFFDSTIVKPLARMGYMEYSVADKPFSLDRP
ncbi:MAG: flavin reductase family protein [Hyphomicrobiales bacterium]